MSEQKDRRLDKIAESVANTVAAKWPCYIEAEDLKQELWLFVLGSDSVRNYLQGNDNKACRKALLMKANSIASKQMDAYEKFSGQYVYSTQEVNKALVEATTTVDGLDFDIKADLEYGMKQLLEEHPQYFQEVWEKHFTSVTKDSESEKRQQRRAIAKLTEIMNRKRNYRERERHEGLGTKPKINQERED